MHIDVIYVQYFMSAKTPSLSSHVTSYRGTIKALHKNIGHDVQLYETSEHKEDIDNG